jgi:hypothetical protein
MHSVEYLLEVVEVQGSDVPAAERETAVRQAPGAAARRVVHPVGQAAEGHASPGCADHQICHL